MTKRTRRDKLEAILDEQILGLQKDLERLTAKIEESEQVAATIGAVDIILPVLMKDLA